MTDRDLLLAGPAFVVDHFGHHAHRAKGTGHFRQECALEVEACLRVDASVVSWLPPPRLRVLDAEVELRFEGGLNPEAPLASAADHVLEPCAGAGWIAFAVLLDQVGAQAGVTREPGQHAECFGVRHHAQLADGLHTFDVDHRIEQGERHLGPRQVDAVMQSVGEVIDRGDLSPLNPGEVAVNEPALRTSCAFTSRAPDASRRRA